MTKANPKIKRQGPSIREGGNRTKSQFVRLTGDIIHHWNVGPLIEIVEQATSYSDWCDVLYEVNCTECGTTTILDRRDIKKGAGCRVCKAQDAAKREVAKESLRVLRLAKRKSSINLIPAAISMAGAGMSQHQIAKHLGTSQATISLLLKKAGVTSKHSFKYQGQVITDPTVKAENKRKERVRYAEKQKAKRVKVCA